MEKVTGHKKLSEFNISAVEVCFDGACALAFSIKSHFHLGKYFSKTFSVEGEAVRST